MTVTITTNRRATISLINRYSRSRAHADRLDEALKLAYREVLRLEAAHGQAEERAAEDLACAHAALAAYGPVQIDSVQWSARSDADGWPDVVSVPLASYGLARLPFLNEATMARREV